MNVCVLVLLLVPLQLPERSFDFFSPPPPARHDFRRPTYDEAVAAGRKAGKGLMVLKGQDERPWVAVAARESRILVVVAPDDARFADGVHRYDLINNTYFVHETVAVAPAWYSPANCAT